MGNGLISKLLGLSSNLFAFSGVSSSSLNQLSNPVAPQPVSDQRHNLQNTYRIFNKQLFFDIICCVS
jgi:hypothetical protein